jgi:hypothetical protein
VKPPDRRRPASASGKPRITRFSTQNAPRRPRARRTSRHPSRSAQLQQAHAANEPPPRPEHASNPPPPKPERAASASARVLGILQTTNPTNQREECASLTSHASNEPPTKPERAASASARVERARGLLHTPIPQTSRMSECRMSARAPAPLTSLRGRPTSSGFPLGQSSSVG